MILSFDYGVASVGRARRTLHLRIHQRLLKPGRLSKIQQIDMTKQTQPFAGDLSAEDSAQSDRKLPEASLSAASDKGPRIRVSRGNQVIGSWSAREIDERLGSEDLLPSDSFYHEGSSDWLPLSEFQGKQRPNKVTKASAQICYCGTGLPFKSCCGDDDSY